MGRLALALCPALSLALNSTLHRMDGLCLIRCGSDVLAYRRRLPPLQQRHQRRELHILQEASG